MLSAYLLSNRRLEEMLVCNDYYHHLTIHGMENAEKEEEEEEPCLPLKLD